MSREPAAAAFGRAIDKLRHEQGRHIKRDWKTLSEIARAWIAEDTEAVYNTIVDKVEQGEQLDDIETIATQEIIQGEALRALQSGDEVRIE